jgi:hypothetical protein
MIPIATCSPENSEQVRAYGAEETFDYKQSDCAARIVGESSPRRAELCLREHYLTNSTFHLIESLHQKQPTIRSRLHHECTDHGFLFRRSRSRWRQIRLARPIRRSRRHTAYRQDRLGVGALYLWGRLNLASAVWSTAKRRAPCLWGEAVEIGGDAGR